MTASGQVEQGDAAAKISARIAEFSDWRGATLELARKLILQADPAMQEEWKWQKPTSPGVPVWSHDGIVCTGEVYKQVVKLTFARGAAIADPDGLFNASLEGNLRRAIDLHKGETITAPAFCRLILAAVAANQAAMGARGRRKLS